MESVYNDNIMDDEADACAEALAAAEKANKAAENANTEAEFAHNSAKNALDAAEIANKAGAAANMAGAGANTAAAGANAASASANTAAERANTASASAEEAAENANLGAQLANNAAENANTAAETAESAAASANAAAAEVNAAVDMAETAAGAANTAANDANAAVAGANTAAERANTASASAEEASERANSAAENANTAVEAAESAAASANAAAAEVNAAVDMAVTAAGAANTAANGADVAAEKANNAAEKAENAGKAWYVTFTERSGEFPQKDKGWTEIFDAYKKGHAVYAIAKFLDTPIPYIIPLKTVTEGADSILIFSGAVDIGTGGNIAGENYSAGMEIVTVYGYNNMSWSMSRKEIAEKADHAYCTCESPADDPNKVVTVVSGDFSLKTGVAIDVKFNNNSPLKNYCSLNVNNTGARLVKFNNSTSLAYGIWKAGVVVRFVYDGNFWIMENGTLASDTCYGVTKLSSSVTDSSTTTAATTSAVKSAYDLASNAIPKSQRAAANGVATLDANGKIPTTQIPEIPEIIKPHVNIIRDHQCAAYASNGSVQLTSNTYGNTSFDLPSFGEWTISSNGQTKTITVDTVKVYTVDFTKPLSDCSWDEILGISESGKAPDMWSVGDEKTITVNGETLTLVIVGFNHDNTSDGSGKAGVTFGLKNLMTDKHAMEATNTNANSFVGSAMYKWLQEEIFTAFPSDLQNAIKSVNKKTHAGNKSAVINTDSMKVFLFSVSEVFGEASGNLSRTNAKNEGIQYPYFATASNRIKRLNNGTGEFSYWWTRTPYNNADRFFVGDVSGTAATSRADNSSGVCFGFCI